MAQQKTKYVLDATEETERLDRQSRMIANDFSRELSFLNVARSQNILDAGCGSGIVSDHLSRLAPGARVTGWDFSKERVEWAMAHYGSSEVEFARMDLLAPDCEPASFDTIVCRYVLHHFSQTDAEKVIRNLIALLKPGGTLYCINIDGLFSDVCTASTFVRRGLEKIRGATNVDFCMGRRAPSLLLKHGLQAVSWHAQGIEFKGERLAHEIENLTQSIKIAQTFLQERLGGKAALERFQSEYLAALQAPGCVLFYNTLITLGKKSERTLQLVT